MNAAARTTYVGVDPAGPSTEGAVCFVTAVVDQGEAMVYELGTLPIASTRGIVEALCRESPLAIAGVAVNRWMGHSLAQQLSDMAATDGRDVPVVLLTSERRATGQARAFNLACRLAKSSSRLFDELGDL